jgi:GNAT superfamily N-acetyltransferase
MNIQIIEESTSSLPDHAAIPIEFRVERILDVTPEPDGFTLTERLIDGAYVKNYDFIEDPSQWLRFDTRNWGLLAAYLDQVRVGGVVMAFDTPGVDLLDRRSDLAVLWDIRVRSDCRGQGVGTALFRAAESWAVQRKCRGLKIETQNINVPACRFYQRQGCVLCAVNRFAYPTLPDEVQFIWMKPLPGEGDDLRSGCPSGRDHLPRYGCRGHRMTARLEAEDRGV